MKKNNLAEEDISKKELQTVFSDMRLRLIYICVSVGWSLIIIMAAYSIWYRQDLDIVHNRSLLYLVFMMLLTHTIGALIPWDKLVVKKNFELMAFPYTTLFILIVSGINLTMKQSLNFIYFIFIAVTFFAAFFYSTKLYVVTSIINNLMFIGSLMYKQLDNADYFFETIGLIFISLISYVLAEEYRKERLGHFRKEKMKDNLINRISSIQTAERSRIGRELHDGIGQSLNSLLINLELISRNSREAATKSKIGDTKNYIIQTIDDIKRIVASLKPTVLDDLGLNYAIEKLVMEQNLNNGIKIILKLPKYNLDLGPEIDNSLFRIVQEALTNISKHSKASLAEILLDRKNGCVRLEIGDNGQGIDSQYYSKNKKLTFGLANIKERVDLLNGKFSIQSFKGEGAKVLIEIPVKDNGGMIKDEHVN